MVAWHDLGIKKSAENQHILDPFSTLLLVMLSQLATVLLKLALEAELCETATTHCVTSL